MLTRLICLAALAAVVVIAPDLHAQATVDDTSIWRRGDANMDGVVNVSDVSYLSNYPSSRAARSRGA